MGIRADTAAAPAAAAPIAITPARPQSPAGSPNLPLWYERGLVVVTAAVVSFGGFGLLLAVVGAYSLLPAFLLGAAGTLAGSVLAWPGRSASSTPAPAPVRTQSGRRPRPRLATAQLPAIGMCLVALGFALWNGAHASQHVMIGRDPGVYTATAKWLATHGDLVVHPSADWGSAGTAVTTAAPGTYLDGHHLEFQFNHLMPVLMAQADNLGGDALMFRVPALLGALALCAVYAVGCRLVRRPWLVLAAVAALGISLPQLNVSRETLSETSVEFLLWAGIWLLLLAYERRRIGLSLLAGAALGATMLARVDATVYLIPLPLLAAFTWLAGRARGDRRSLARMYAGVLVTSVPIGVLGTVDVRYLSGHYYADLAGQIHALQGALALSVVLALAVALLWPMVSVRASALSGWVAQRRMSIGQVVACLLVLGLLAAWTLRAALMHPRGTPTDLVGGLQREEGLVYDPARTYGEQSMHWISWYLGPVTVALAIVAVAVLVMRIARTGEPAALVVLSVAGVGTALYLWKPSIVPDQIWAMRRFVPAGLPLFVLLAAVAVEALAASVASRAGITWTRPTLALGAAALLFFPAAITKPVRNFRPQAGYLGVVTAVCRVTGPNAAVAFAAKDPDEQLALAVRSWCDVPVATLQPGATTSQVAALAAGWHPDGRTLWVLAASAAAVAKTAPGLTPRLVASAADPRELAMVIERAPQHYSPRPIAVYATPVPAG